MSTSKDSAIRIVKDQSEELPSAIYDSMEACIGAIQIQISALCNELTLTHKEQSSEKLLQSFVTISAISLAAIDVHVLPELGEEEQS